MAKRKTARPEIDGLVTGVIVSYMQKQLLKQCIESIRAHYPTLPLVIVDGSDYESPCYNYVTRLPDPHIKVLLAEGNIGHGRGLKWGIEHVQTPYFAMIDSDTVMKAPPFDAMLSLLGDSAYGCGLINRTDLQGNNHPNGPIEYLHPYFCLINKALYGQYSPPIHHGAPLIRTMIELRGKGLLRPFNLSPYVVHLCRGTRSLNPEEFKPRNWERV